MMRMVSKDDGKEQKFGKHGKDDSYKGKKISEIVGSLPKISVREKHFIGQMITGSVPLKELTKNTPKQVLNTEISKDAPGYDISALLVSLAEHQSQMPFTSKSAVPVVIHDPDTRMYKLKKDTSSIVKKVTEGLLVGDNPPVEQIWRPEMVCNN